MPIYEYEPVDRDCRICDNRFETIQGVNDEAYVFCPYCGMNVKRVVSRATFKLPTNANPDRAGERGLTTYRKVEKGKWEKIGGPGADMMVGSDEDMKAIEEEKAKKPKKFDLDA